MALPTKKREKDFENADDFFSMPFFPMRMPMAKFFEMSEVKTPAIELKDEGKELIATIEIPGVDKTNIKLKINDNSLIVSAEKKKEKEEKGKNKYYSERSYSSFYRSFSLPVQVDSNKVKAKYENGVLEVRMEKKKSKSGTEIKVK
jgi:HSP20 family protein